MVTSDDVAGSGITRTRTEAGSTGMRLRRKCLRPVVGQVQLETADASSRVAVSEDRLECSEPLATAAMASLRARTQLASVHVLDHALAQRAYNIGTRWAAPVWDEVDDTSILKTGRHGRYRRFPPWSLHSQSRRPPQLAIAQRFSAVAHRDQFFIRTSCQLSGAKRKWAARQSPPPRSRMTQCMVRPCVARRFRQVGGERSCINVSDL